MMLGIRLLILGHPRGRREACLLLSELVTPSQLWGSSCLPRVRIPQSVAGEVTPLSGHQRGAPELGQTGSLSCLSDPWTSQLNLRKLYILFLKSLLLSFLITNK